MTLHLKGFTEKMQNAIVTIKTILHAWISLSFTDVFTAWLPTIAGGCQSMSTFHLGYRIKQGPP